MIASNQVEEYFRVNSLFFDPNIYGRFLALVMIGLASVLIWAKRPRSLFWTIVALVVLWGGLITTLSQSSFAALLLGLAVLAWLRWGAKVVALPALAVVVAGAVLVFAFPGALRLDLGDSGSIDKATSGRFDLMRGGVDLAREKPLLGWGAGSFNAEYRAHEKSSGREATAASHTIPITVAAEQGIVGFAAYVALLVLAFMRLLRGARGSPVRAAIAAGFAALVLHTWLYAAFLEDPVTWTLLALGTALAFPPGESDRARRGRGGGPQRPSPRGRGRGALGHIVSGSRFARPVEYAALALALGVAVLVWALTRTYPNYDSYYHLVWGRQLLDGLEPTFTAYAAPTQHPLYVALGAVLGLRVRRERGSRPRARVPALARAAGLRHLPAGRGGLRALERRAGGAVRRRERVVPAVRRARLRRRTVPRAGRVGGRAGGDRPVPWVLLVLAGLLRPEAWVLTGLAWLWTMRRRASLRARRRPRLLARRRVSLRATVAVLFAPLFWALTDLVVTGDPLHSLHATSELADDLGRVRGLQHVPGSFVSFVGATVRPPVAVLAPIGAVLAWRLLGWERMRVPLALFAAGVITFVGTGALGPVDPPALPDRPRRLAVPVRRLRPRRLRVARALHPWRRRWAQCSAAATVVGADRPDHPRALPDQRPRGDPLHPRHPRLPDRDPRRPRGPRRHALRNPDLPDLPPGPGREVAPREREDRRPLRGPPPGAASRSSRSARRPCAATASRPERPRP